MHIYSREGLEVMRERQPWPMWRAHVQSVWQRTVAYALELTRRRATSEPRPWFFGGTVVPLEHVLRILLTHEISKQQGHVSWNENESLSGGPDDERVLGDLLRAAGWPERRVRRVTLLRWRRTHFNGDQLADLHLAPVPWVLRLGRGSTRAADVAEGAAIAMHQGAEDFHLDSIRRAMAESPHPRVLVLRASSHEPIVEDGNHFVVASLLQFPNLVDCPPIPALIGERPTETAANEVLQTELRADSTESQVALTWGIESDADPRKRTTGGAMFSWATTSFSRHSRL
jgi:hypothetical protein